MAGNQNDTMSDNISANYYQMNNKYESSSINKSVSQADKRKRFLEMKQKLDEDDKMEQQQLDFIEK